MGSTAVAARTDQSRSNRLHPGFYWRDVISTHDISQLALAERSGLSKKHVNQILQGLTLPSAATVVRMARAIDEYRPRDKRDGGRGLAALMWKLQAAYVLEDAFEETPR